MNMKTGQCQRTGPFGWTDQSAKNCGEFNQPQGEEKVCQASLILRIRGGEGEEGEEVQPFPSLWRWKPGSGLE